MKKFKRVIAIILVLAIIFCTLISPISYAFAITLVSLASAAVVAAVLTACGVVMTQPETFTSLCDSICDAAKFSAKLPIKVMAGVGYVSTEVIDKVITTANSLKAFKPESNSSFIFQGISFPVFPPLSFVDGSCDSSFISLNPVSFSLPPKSAVSSATAVSVAYNSFLTVKLYNSTWVYNKPYIACDFYFNGRYLFGCFVNPSIFPFHFSSPFVQHYPDGSNYFTIGPVHNGLFSFNDVSIGTRCSVNVNELGGSISAEFPWLNTDHLPGIDEGTKDITYPGVAEGWKTGAVPIDGVPSLPVAVNSENPAKVGSQTQSEAQTGIYNPSDSKPGTGDLAIPDAKVIDDTLKNLSLPMSIADYFPFCIPFDLVKGVKLLVSPPADPVFDIPIQLPYIGEQHLKIDLRQFEGLAVICRWFLMVMFIVSLALLTPKVIKW